jgi:NAD(P)-dependent dehydrogenase (short-subunit alcohol dehydrogenase family)
MAIGYYGIAKLALNGITQSLARELGPMNIRVNAIAPGPTDTEATRSIVPEEYIKHMLAQMPLARMASPRDIVGTCLFLLSDDASWLTGQVINVDGGQVMRP